jgi:hypothetical protein
VPKTKTSLEEATVAIFENKTQMPNGELIRQLVEKTGASEMQVRTWIAKTSLIEWSTDPNYKRRKIAIFTGILKEQDKPKSRVRDRTTFALAEIVTYLQRQIDKQAPLVEIGYHLQRHGYSYNSVYSYVERLDNVTRYDVNGRAYVRLLSNEPIDIESPNFSFLLVSQITEQPLRSDIERALKLFNIDNIDVGLFQIGKMFENELKAFLLVAMNQKAFPVSNKDISTLSNMINCVDREKIITKKHHLDLLREQRNMRSHGEIAQLQERQKLLNHAHFLGELYLQYIVFFHDKRLEMV